MKLVGGTFQIQDWFAPRNSQDPPDERFGFSLKTFDGDLGSAGPVAVPNSRLLLAGGKEGRLYLIDRSDMGRGTKFALQSFQVTRQPRSNVPGKPTKAGEVLFWNIHGAPVIWPTVDNMFVYVMGEEDNLKQYRLVPDGASSWTFDRSFEKKSPETPGLPPPNLLNDPHRRMIWMPGGFLTLSGDKSSTPPTAIVWATMPFNENANHAVVRGALRAFDASDVSKGQIWGSEDSEATNNLGFFAKYNPPVIANGRVYVATFHQERMDNNRPVKAEGGLKPALVIYGLK